MRIPVTIHKNTLVTYNNYQSDKKVKNTLRSNDLSNWDKDLPKSLQEICLQTIANNWEANPLLEEIQSTIDRCFLLDILPTDLPLSLTVPKINDDIYWRRCYLERWPKLLPGNVSLQPQIHDIVTTSINASRRSSCGSSNRSQKSRQKSNSSNERKWKECYLEMHVRDYLEKLKPEDYDAEKIKELSDLCGRFVKKLELRELQASENSPIRIPLNAVVTGLENLTELCICFKQKYVGEDFSWNILKVTPQDVKLLAKGLQKCNLQVFRLRNSDINDEKAVIILNSLLKHEDLQTLDFSHCQLSDDSAIALSKFCVQNPVQELILANNRIDAKGVQALCFAICQSNCCLNTLDLRLNLIRNEGVQHLINLLGMGVRNVKKLYLNGCGIKHLPAIGEMIEHNSSLEELSLSNNDLGQDMGKIILQGLRYNTSLTKLDVRMCKLLSEDEFEILRRINKNRIAKRCPRTKSRPIIIEPQFSFEIPEELLNEIESAFTKIAEPDDEGDKN